MYEENEENKCHTGRDGTGHMHAPTHPLCTPTQPIPASSQAELTSPEGIPVIAAGVHIVDGSAMHHAAPGNTRNAKMRWKANYATTVLRQLMELREQRRGEALASSRGQRIASALERWPSPRIIMVGALNTTVEAMQEAMGQLHRPDQADRRMAALHHYNMVAITDNAASDKYEGLGRITGADNRHEAGCYDIRLDSVAQISDRDATQDEPGQVDDAATQAVAQGPEEPQSWQQEEAHGVIALREQLHQGPRPGDDEESEQLLSGLIMSVITLSEDEFTWPPAQ